MAVIRVLMEFIRILLTVTRPVSLSFLDLVYRVIYGAKKMLPDIDDGILLIPAMELAQKIRRKELKAEDVVKAYIKRIKEVEPLINSCVDQRFQEALDEAKEVDRLITSGSKSEEELERETPLLGIPFSCKESLGVKGLAQTCGIYAAKDRKAPEDGVATALYRKAGAIPLVATNVPQFCTWWDTSNAAFGATLNPYDNVRCVGGSSGGEAAIIAYAGAVIGIGNDLAGSIRMPSAFNGIYGHKPTPGMISNVGFWPSGGEDTAEIDKFVGTGPMCRYAQDLPLLAKIMSEQRINFDRKVDFRKVKVYYMEEFPGYLLKPIPDIKSAVRQAAKHFQETFDSKPVQITIPELGYGLEIWESKLLEGGIPPFRDVIAAPGQRVSLLVEFFRNLFRCSEHTLQAVYFAAIERREQDSDYHQFLAMFDRLKKKLDEVLVGDAILLMPTHPEPAPHHLLTIPKYPNVAYTCVFNVLGYPSTQVPAGLSDGLPIGLQVVGGLRNDSLCITAAVELEKVFGGWRSPSKITKR